MKQSQPEQAKRGRTIRFTISSHGPPLVQGQWRGAGDVFQFLGHIFAQAAQLAAAMGTVRAAGSEFDLDARNMVRNWLALGLVGRRVLGQAQLGRHRGDGDLGCLQSQLQLLGSL